MKHIFLLLLFSLLLVACGENQYTVPVQYGATWNCDTIPGCDFNAIVSDSSYTLSHREMLGFKGKPYVVEKTNVDSAGKQYTEHYYFSESGNIVSYDIDHPKNSLSLCIPDIIGPNMQVVSGKLINQSSVQGFTNTYFQRNSLFSPMLRMDIMNIPSIEVMNEKNKGINGFYVFYKDPMDGKGYPYQIAIPIRHNVYGEMVQGVNMSPDPRFSNVAPTGTVDVKTGEATTTRVVVGADRQGGKGHGIIGFNTVDFTYEGNLISSASWKDDVGGYNTAFKYDNSTGVIEKSGNVDYDKTIVNKEGQIIQEKQNGKKEYGTIMRYLDGRLVYMRSERNQYRWNYDKYGRLKKAFLLEDLEPEGPMCTEYIYKYPKVDRYGNIKKREIYIKKSSLQDFEHAEPKLLCTTTFKYSYRRDDMVRTLHYSGRAFFDSKNDTIDMGLCIKSSGQHSMGYLFYPMKGYNRFELVNGITSGGMAYFTIISDTGQEWGNLEFPCNPIYFKVKGDIGFHRGPVLYDVKLDTDDLEKLLQQVDVPQEEPMGVDTTAEEMYY